MIFTNDDTIFFHGDGAQTMGREICNYEFEAKVKGEDRVLKGTGAGSFEGSRDAIIQVMRHEGVSYLDIKIGKTLHETPTGEWV